MSYRNKTSPRQSLGVLKTSCVGWEDNRQRQTQISNLSEAKLFKEVLSA